MNEEFIKNYYIYFCYSWFSLDAFTEVLNCQKKNKLNTKFLDTLQYLVNWKN